MIRNSKEMKGTFFLTSFFRGYLIYSFTMRFTQRLSACTNLVPGTVLVASRLYVPWFLNTVELSFGVRTHESLCKQQPLTVYCDRIYRK